MQRFAPSRRAGYAASIGGAVAPSTPAFTNTYSLDFDGTNDHLVVANHDDFSFGDSTTDTPFSISAWVKADNLSGVRFVTKNEWDVGTDYREWIFSGHTGKLLFGVVDADGSSGAYNNYRYRQESTARITTGIWYHVVGTYDGSGGTNAHTGIKLYVNASVASSYVDTTAGTYVAMHNNTGSNGDIAIGAWRNTSFTDGKIDEVAIWDVELDAEAVTAIYNEVDGVGVPFDLASDNGNYDNSGSLVGYWRMEENTGTTVADSSTNSHTAPLTNGPTFSTDVPS